MSGTKYSPNAVMSAISEIFFHLQLIIVTFDNTKSEISERLGAIENNRFQSIHDAARLVKFVLRELESSPRTAISAIYQALYGKEPEQATASPQIVNASMWSRESLINGLETANRQIDSILAIFKTLQEHAEVFKTMEATDKDFSRRIIQARYFVEDVLRKLETIPLDAIVEIHNVLSVVPENNGEVSELTLERGPEFSFENGDNTSSETRNGQEEERTVMQKENGAKEMNIQSEQRESNNVVIEYEIVEEQIVEEQRNDFEEMSFDMPFDKVGNEQIIIQNEVVEEEVEEETDKEPTGQPTALAVAPPETADELLDQLYKKDIGREPFVAFLKEHDHKLKNDKMKIEYHADGKDLEKKLGDFSHVHLVRSAEGLGMVLPTLEVEDSVTKEKRRETLSFRNFDKMLPKNAKVNMVVSNENTSAKRKLSEILNPIRKELDGKKMQRKEILNVLSLEVSKEKNCNSFIIPQYASENGLIDQIRKSCAARNEAIEEERKYLEESSTDNGNEKEQKRKVAKLKKEMKKIKAILENLPAVEKFVLITMKDSFTDTHVDFTGTAVFFHVVTGKKIFYVAPPTEENLKLYREAEMQAMELEKRSLLHKMSSQFQKVEINSGETAFIPSGVIHFVYTPVDSLCVGGNFLRRESLDLHFSQHRAELASEARKESVLRNFYPSMFAYLKYVLIPALQSNTGDALDLKIAETFCRELRNEQDGHDKMFSEEEKKRIFSTLESLTQSRKRPAAEEPQGAPKAKRVAMADNDVEKVAVEKENDEDTDENSKSAV